MFDDAGRAKAFINPLVKRTSTTYDAAGRADAGQRTVQKLANSTRASYSYDAANQLLKVANIRSDASTISAFTYKYDPMGNRTRVVEADGSRVTWSYDNIYQLTREWRTGTTPFAATYSYDATGNRRTKLESGVTTTYTCDAANQLLTLKDITGTTTYAYDANGNQRVQHTGSERTTFAWDYESRPTTVRLAAGTITTFSYDADNRRVQKQNSAASAKYVWDLDAMLLETNLVDVTQAVYSIPPNGHANLLSQRRDADTRYYHFDATGSTDRLTNTSAGTTDSYVYSAFGLILGSTGATINPYQYAGQRGYYVYSGINGYLVNHRFYHASTARFIGMPARFLLDLIRGTYNPYRYSRSNPLLLLEPSGERSEPSQEPTAQPTLPEPKECPKLPDIKPESQLMLDTCKCTVCSLKEFEELAKGITYMGTIQCVKEKCTPYINVKHKDYALALRCGVVRCTQCKELRGCELLDKVKNCKDICKKAKDNVIIIATGPDKRCEDAWECITLEVGYLCLVQLRLKNKDPQCEQIINDTLKDIGDRIKKHCAYLKKGQKPPKPTIK